MKNNLLRHAALSLWMLATPALAETNTSLTSNETQVGFVEDLGAADRILAADRLRTLTQEISSATCFLFNDMLATENRALLSHSISEFDELLDALLNGDSERHIIGKEENRKTIREIEAIMAEWAPLHEAAQDVLDDPTDANAAHVIYAQSSHLLETTAHLLSELEGEYSHPSQVLMSDVLLMEFAGRQAMTTQKIAFESCLVWSGVGGQEQMDDLKKISTQFDLIARALHDGMPTIGIAAAPTEEIRVALEEVVIDWDDVLEHLDHITAGGEISVEEIAWICKAMTKKMIRMEVIVKMYADYSRRAIL